MVLPPEMIMATIRGDLGALQTFLDQHPERVDDVADEADPMAHRTMSQIAIMCLVPPKELLRLRSQIARGKVVATRATPQHLARLFSRSLPNEIAWRVLAFWNPRY